MFRETMIFWSAMLLLCAFLVCARVLGVLEILSYSLFFSHCYRMWAGERALARVFMFHILFSTHVESHINRWWRKKCTAIQNKDVRRISFMWSNCCCAHDSNEKKTTAIKVAVVLWSCSLNASQFRSSKNDNRTMESSVQMNSSASFSDKNSS